MDGKMDSEQKFGKLIKGLRDYSTHFDFCGYTIEELGEVKLKVPVIELPEQFKALMKGLLNEVFYEDGIDATGWAYFVGENGEPIGLLFLHNWNQSAYPSGVRGKDARDSYINRKEMEWESMMRDGVPNDWRVDEEHSDDMAQDGQYKFIALRPDAF